MTPIMRVDRLWPESTIVCLGTGPSLTQADVESCRGKARVIAVNNAYQIAPWADVMYACDAKFWKWHLKAAYAFEGLKFGMRPGYPIKGLALLRNMGKTGLSTDRTGLKTGYNSGYQAINLAVLLGARRIVLLGYDMQGDHYFGSHPDKTKPPFARCLEAFQTLVAPLQQANVEIVNCTRQTALRCFPCAPLESVWDRAA